MAEIYFTKDHEWIKVEDNIGVVGITAYASEQLGDIVFVELPEEGMNIEIGKDIAVVESVKAASEVYSPVSGKIIKSKRENSPNNEINCFGFSLVERGHSLFPEPPARIIGLNLLEHI